MNIQVTFNPEEMLKNIDRKVVLDYIKNTITDEEKEEIGNTINSIDPETLWETLERKMKEDNKDLATFVSNRMESYDLLNNIDEEEILNYIKDNTQYYISENVEELMEQIKVSGCLDEVTELFEMKYIG